jgi:multidrug efflux pump subunit AcrB
MCGIIINDSILKIDTINRLRRKGMSLDNAIHTTGKRRLKAIVLTSLTTMLAVTPLLFTHDMGAELQQPFALVIISGMFIGTIVSLFVIPLAYKAIYKFKKNIMK